MRTFAIIISLMLTSGLSHAKFLENQAKLKTDSSYDSVVNSIETMKQPTINELIGTFLYQDIYLDTDDFLLLEKGFSFRLRKKIVGKEVTYTAQLKSEQSGANTVRLEVEDEDLSFYQLRRGSIVEAIDALLESQTNPQRVMQLTNDITEWLAYKYNSDLAVMQELRNIFPGKTLKFKPTLKLKSERRRYNMKKVTVHDLSLGSSDETIVAVASFDHYSSQRINPATTKVFESSELELESKLPTEDAGNELLGAIISKLSASIDLKVEPNSKYKQSMDFLSNN